MKISKFHTNKIKGVARLLRNPLYFIPLIKPVY